MVSADRLEGSCVVVPVQNLISPPEVLLTRVVTEALADPSKDAEPDTVPDSVIVRAVASFVAVPALPETVVWSGWTWSLRAAVLAEPADAVPGAEPAVLPSWSVLPPVVVIVTLPDPSNDAEPETTPESAIVRAVASFVAVPALPLTVVWSG